MIKFFERSTTEELVGLQIAPVLPSYSKPWFFVPHLLRLNLLLIIPLLTYASGGYDGSLMNGLQSLEAWKKAFGNPSGSRLGLINGAYSIGSFAATFIMSILSDKLGRKKTLVVGLVTMVVGTIIQSATKNYAALVISRLITGFGGSLASQPAILLISELSYPLYRGQIAGIFTCCYFVGSIISSWTCYGTSGRTDDFAWRIPAVVQLCIPVLQLLFIFFLPESPRWLISRNQIPEARSILVKHHAGGDENSELVDVEISEIIEALQMENAARETKWSDLVKTPGNKKRTYIAVTMGLSLVWNGNSVIAYYFTLVLDTIGITSSSMQTLLNGLMNIMNLVVCISAALFVDKLGRRFLFLYSSFGMLITYTIATILTARFDITGNDSTGKAVVAFIFIFSFHYCLGWGPLFYSYAAEIFPFYSRAKGVALASSFSYGSNVVANFANSIAMDNLGWKYYIFYCCMLFLISLNVFFFFPETKGYSLEEIARIFDGDTHELSNDFDDLKEDKEEIEDIDLENV